MQFLMVNLGYDIFFSLDILSNSFDILSKSFDIYLLHMAGAV